MSAAQIREFWQKLDKEAKAQQEQKEREKPTGKKKEKATPPVDPEKKRFDDRWAKIGAVVRSLDGELGTKHSSPVPEDLIDDLNAAAKDYHEAKEAVAKAESAGKWPEANEALDDLELAIGTLEPSVDAVNLALKEEGDREKYYQDRARYFNRFNPIADRVHELEHWVNNDKIAGHDQEKEDFSKANGKHFMAMLKRPADYAAAYKSLDVLEPAVQALETAIGAAEVSRLEKEFPATSDPDEIKDKKVLERLKKETHARRLKLEKLADKLTKSTRGIEALEDAADTFATAAATPRADAKAAEKAKQYPQARTALDQFEKAIEAFQQAIQQEALKQIQALEKKKNTTPAKLRAEAMQWAKIDPTALRALEPDLLDDMMANLGSDAKSDGDKTFAKAALVARFGLTNLEGDLSTKALPRLYKVFKMVPDSHTRDNPRLQQVKRDQPLVLEKSSYYSDQENLVYLSLARTGERFAKLPLIGEVTREEFNPDADVKDEDRPGGGAHSRFDATTLHEIGHAVDENVGFMRGKAGNAEFGGWRTVTVTEVATVALEQKGFAASFGAYPKAWLRTYLEYVLKNEDPQKKLKSVTKVEDLGSTVATAEELLADVGLKQAETDRRKLEENGWDQQLASKAAEDANNLVKLRDKKQLVARAVVETVLSADASVRQPLREAIDTVLARGLIETKVNPDDQRDWKELAKHEAVKWCEKIRLKGGSSGLWDKGKAGASDAAVGGRVYHQAYKWQWVSYDLAARARGVSQYQFRAEGEWFAEAYSAFFLDKLADSHPLYDWLTKEKATA